MRTTTFKICFVSTLLTICIPAFAATRYNMAAPAPSPHKDLIDVPNGAVARARMPKIELPPGCDPTRKDPRNNPCFSPSEKTLPKQSAVPASAR